MAIKKGDRIKVEYTGKLDDGTVFDSNAGKEPLEFEVGSGSLIKGFDSAVNGMSKGETKITTIKPQDGYGMQNERKVLKVPKENFSGGIEFRRGLAIILKGPDGQAFQAVVKDFNENEVTLDMNHPLAGKNLNFEIKILEC